MTLTRSRRLPAAAIVAARSSPLQGFSNGRAMAPQRGWRNLPRMTRRLRTNPMPTIHTMREVMPRLLRTRSIAAAVVAALALAAAPAHAFDAGPHTDMTRDALTAEGFGSNAANVGVVENWFVDYYWNAKENPFSGHGDMLTEMLANADPATKEYWPQFVVDGTNHMHFDSSQPGFPDLSNPQGVDEEWQRLMRVTRNALAQAKSSRDPLTVMAVVGMSLHTVQDFYAHTSWVETAGKLGSPDGPGWSPAYGSFPTYFDIPKSARDSRAVYSAVNGVSRRHGKWQTDNNDSHEHGMNKDWPRRPLYERAYGTAYFASRQWIRAARGWLNDDALWGRAQRLAAPSGLKADLRAALDISKYSGHWQGNGQPCAHAIVFCGDLYGWAGSVLGLRSAIKTYHEDHRKSPARKRFEDFASNFDEQHGTERVAEPTSSRDIQLGTRLVKLEVPRMRGYDWALGDPGPDDADLYVNASIRGQDFDSPVIHDHDRFSFPKPYGSFTWIRSVPAGWRASTPVSTLTVQVKTGDRRFAGTDDDVYLRVDNGLRFSLEKRAYNDFERGDDDTYAVPLDAVTRAGMSVKDITMAQLEKSRDGVGGAWFLQSFAVRLNGRPVASKVVNRWMEDDHRTASASMTRDHRASDIVPVWVSLEEDDYLYGFDDDGDVNPFDRNTAVSFGYMPGREITREDTGGDRLSGRLSMQNGEKGQLDLRMSTIRIVAPPPLPAVPTPTPTPTPSPTPTPTPSPPPNNKPDLVITAFDTSSITVKNQGSGAAGPFSISATSYPPMMSAGLAPGASQTFGSGHGCTFGQHHAIVDPMDQVKESNESNNTADIDAIC
jgi:PLAT/LH2 domain